MDKCKNLTEQIWFQNCLGINVNAKKSLMPTTYTMCPADTATAGSWAGVGLVN
jgi:hypothetical protein